MMRHDLCARRPDVTEPDAVILKRAELVAAEIEDRIIEMGWPEGELIGVEPELIEQFGVSRSVLREAIRLLEHHNVAVMRRGRNGGLRVSRPNPTAVANAVALYLRFRNVSESDLFDVRVALEMTAASLAAKHATEEDIHMLRSVAAAETNPEAQGHLAVEFHEAIAQTAKNPAILLFVQVINKLTGALIDHSPDEDVALGAHKAHNAIAEAIATGDAALAQRRLLRHFEAAAEAGFPVSVELA
jgi:DNA-binding FadR family transcriptional regulator